MPGIVPLPADNAAWLAELKARIHAAQQRATLAVNRKLVQSSNRLLDNYPGAITWCC